MRHAPKGGTSVDGDRYEGGQFLPEDDFSSASRRRAAARQWPRRGASVKIDAFSGTYCGVIVAFTKDQAQCRYSDERGELTAWFPLRAVTEEITA